MRAILWAILQLHIAGANISCLARQLSTGVEYRVVLNQTPLPSCDRWSRPFRSSVASRGG